MLVYRIGKIKHSLDLSGEGSKLYGGRWNIKGHPCIYASESRALALLEYTVNVNIDEIPGGLSITLIEIPNRGIKDFKISDLPEDWASIPATFSTRTFGTQLLTSNSNAIFKIPSIIISKEFNFILNPLHPESKLFKIVDVESFIYDVRIKL